jgi:phosphatidylserine decarboxylase
MRIAKEGYRVIAIPGLFAVIAGVMGWVWAFVVLGLITLAEAAFFRDPDRVAPPGEDLILAPADGKIVDIRKDAAGSRLSIFMSPLDVHVNRAPARGRVEDIQYHKGRFVAAYRDDASENNEQNALTMIDPKGRRLGIVQIAGVLARRIVCRVHKGDALEAGERFGIIMFGSRVDLQLPPGAHIVVTRGQRVTGGETIVARSA